MKVLCVGKVCLDIINYVEGYPVEDSDHTIPFQRWAQGGNAANNCVVFNQLRQAFHDQAKDFEFELFGTLGTDLASNFVRNLLRDDNGVQLDRCPAKEGKGLLSTSCVMVNRQNGSRTIVHARNDIRDVTFEHFVQAKFDLGDYDWINFENRESAETKRMLELVLSWKVHSGSPRPVVSVEIEKNKKGSDQLLTLGVDYLFISKDFAQSHQCKNMEEAVLSFSRIVDLTKTTIVCPWGDKGACLLARGYDRPFSCPARHSERAMDTLGAGDTFFASFIFARCQLRKTANEALELACLVAGLKCGMIGYDGLGEAVLKCV